MALPAEAAPVIPLWRERARRRIDPDLAAELDKVHDLPWGSKLFRFYRAADSFSDEVRAYLGLIDRFYLLVSILHRTDFLKQGAKGGSAVPQDSAERMSGAGRSRTHACWFHRPCLLGHAQEVQAHNAGDIVIGEAMAQQCFRDLR